MTKHRRITGFVIVALLAVVATTANVRSHSHSTGLLAASPAMSPGELTVAMKKPPDRGFRRPVADFPEGDKSLGPIQGEERKHPAMERVAESFR
jgi:hypothetical protein